MSPLSNMVYYTTSTSKINYNSNIDTDMYPHMSDEKNGSLKLTMATHSPGTGHLHGRQSHSHAYLRWDSLEICVYVHVKNSKNRYKYFKRVLCQILYTFSITTISHDAHTDHWNVFSSLWGLSLYAWSDSRRKYCSIYLGFFLCNHPRNTFVYLGGGELHPLHKIIFIRIFAY